MFPDSFVANFVLFTCGQIAAWGYLRTGLVARGAFLMIALWVLLDVALVARFAFQDTGVPYVVALTAMQVYAVLEFLHLSLRRLHRSRAAIRARRTEQFEIAFRHYLRDEVGQAVAIYARLIRSDPWDIESRLALATALSRSGQRGKARRMFRSVRNFDRADHFDDVLTDELGRLSVRGGDRAVAANGAAPGPQVRDGGDGEAAGRGRS